MTLNTTRIKQRTDLTTSVCHNCLHDGDCVLQRNSPTAITFCEEHAVETVLEPVRITAPEVPKAMAVHGLCGTCDNLLTCVLRSTEHITHHCEHYR
jgi:hypothetical protein